MQVERGAGFLLQLTGGQEVIKVRVGMNDADHLQTEGIEASEDQLMIAARINDDGLFRDWIADFNPNVVASTSISVCIQIWTWYYWSPKFMSRRNTKINNGQERYTSKARRVLIREFRMLTVNLATSSTAAGTSHRLPEYKTAEANTGYYPNFPVIIQGNGEPWRIGNLYLTTKLENEGSYESRTHRTIADHLLDYLRFLENEELDYLHLPKNNRLKATFRYKQHLVRLRDIGDLAPSTASARINAVVNFYRSIIDWKLINEIELQNYPFEDSFKTLNITSKFGTESIIKIRSHNLAIRTPKPQLQPEYIVDGGSLRPLTFPEQSAVLKSLLASSREYQLMFYFALFTGARAQTVGTIRTKSIQGKLDKNGYLRLQVGSGTPIDTKRGNRMTLLVPGWLVKDMLIYSQSAEAIKRRKRSFYGNTEDNYLFLSKSGTPYYTSKKELFDRRKNEVSMKAGMADRAQSTSIQDGAALRQHIREILSPRIRLENPEFQNFTFHDLRATFGMNLLESQLHNLGNSSVTAALDYVQQRMGHRDKMTTLQYLNYKSRLEWKVHIQTKFEQKLFIHINTQQIYAPANK
ncbi:Phage integrase family protein [compost metagenome]